MVSHVFLFLFAVFLSFLNSIYRTQSVTEWPSQAAHERLVCRTLFDGSRPVEFSVAVPAYADGPVGLGT